MTAAKSLNQLIAMSRVLGDPALDYAILGEGNVAYGPQLPGVNQIWHLINVNISNVGGGTLYGAKETTIWDIQGGSHTASAAAAIFSIADAAQVSVTRSPALARAIMSGRRNMD